MNNYKEKLFKGITYTAALFTIIFLFAIIISIFYEGAPIITQRVGQFQVEAKHKNYLPPWQIEKGDRTVRAYCEVLINNDLASEQDQLAAFVDGECRGVSGITHQNGIALSTLEIEAKKEDAGKIVKFVVYDNSYDDVFAVVGVAILKFDEELGESDYPILLEAGTPYLHPRKWNVVEYDQSTLIYCQPSIFGMPLDAGDEVGVFVGEECRGVGKAELINGNITAKITVYGDKPETAVFAIYDTSDRTVMSVDKKIQTSPGSVIGSLSDLVVLDGFIYFGGEPQIFSRPWNAVYDPEAEHTTAYCEITIDNIAADVDDEVAAFINGECRSIGRITKKGKRALAELDIPGYKNEIIHFAVWDTSQNKVLGIENNTIAVPGGQIGNSPNKPVIAQYLEKIGLFVFGSSWHPTSTPGRFGILTLIVGSLLVTIGALILAVPFGIGSAIYISEIASPRSREIIKPIIELLAGIPSVVYGLFGMAFLSPMLMKWFHINAGLNILNASIILGVMVIPIISSMSEDALSMVPRDLRNASYGLGANRWETIIRVVLPAAKTGVISSILLGFGRAIGETMVVIMVAGGSPQFPKSIFESVRPMTSAIAAEMGETAHGTLHFHALYGIAVVLFVITFTTNLISELTFHKVKKD